MNATDAIFDANVLLYLLSAHATKVNQAETLLAGGGTVSVQVLNGIALVTSRKLGMPVPETREVLEVVRAVCHVGSISDAIHDRGLTICERYKFSIYDSMIVASALLADCRVLFSGDLHCAHMMQRISRVAVSTRIVAKCIHHVLPDVLSLANSYSDENSATWQSCLGGLGDLISVQ